MIASLSAHYVFFYSLPPSVGCRIEISVYTEDPSERWTLHLRDSELFGLLNSREVANFGTSERRMPTPFGFGLLADFITDHIDRLASVATVYPATDPVPVLLLWRDWCRTQFERSQQ